MPNDYATFFKLDKLDIEDESLAILGRRMKERGRDSNTEVDAGYVYLGQFISHDLSKLDRRNRIPSKHGASIEELKNLATTDLDLDSLYGTGWGDDGVSVNNETGEMNLRPTIESEVDGIVLRSTLSDLPRKTNEDLTPHIPDHRNDENLIIAQLHVQFLKLHNLIVRKVSDDLSAKDKFEIAKKEVTKIFHGIILYDYLETVLHEPVFQRLVNEGEVKLYDRVKFGAAMPIEFSVAAGRFGHSMVRTGYRINKLRDPGKKSLEQLFDLTSGGELLLQDGGLQEMFVIDWDFFFRPNSCMQAKNPARHIDAFVAVEIDPDPESENQESILAKRNLARGDEVGLPSAQDFVKKLLSDHPEFEELDLKILKSIEFDRRWKLLDENGIDQSIKTNTPLWFYILGEADYFSVGRKLGPLGSLIVGSVIVGLLKHTHDSIIRKSNYRSFIVGGGKVLTMRDVIDLNK